MTKAQISTCNHDNKWELIHIGQHKYHMHYKWYQIKMQNNSSNCYHYKWHQLCSRVRHGTEQQLIKMETETASSSLKDAAIECRDEDMLFNIQFSLRIF